MGKLTKDISKLTKVPHPKSRKTAKLTKKIIRQDNRKKTKQSHSIKTNITAERYLWFKNELASHDVCTPHLLSAAVTKYLGRFEEEVEMINMKHGIGRRRNRQHASREDVIKMTKANELDEFNNCGIELPDVFNPKQFAVLKTWNGELRFLQNFKLARFSRPRLESLMEADKQKAIPSRNDEVLESGSHSNEEICQVMDGNNDVIVSGSEKVICDSSKKVHSSFEEPPVNINSNMESEIVMDCN